MPLIIDGIRYYEWTPKDEEKEFHPLVRKNSKQIFGEKSIYLDIKPRLSSKSGLGGIPDAYVINLSNPPSWYIVENELSAHDVYDHIVGQVSRFMSLKDKLENQRTLIEAFSDEIDKDLEIQAFVKKRIKKEIHRFVSDLVAQPPKIALIIDSISPKLDEAKVALKNLADTEVIELRTFIRENAENVQVHLISQEQTIKGGEPKPPTKSSQERAQRYLEFFQDLTNRLQQKVPTAVANPKPSYYCKLPTSLGSGVHFEWLFGGNPRARLGVELHFERSPKETNIKLLKQFEKYKGDIEKATGEKVIFQENWTKLSSRIYIEKREGQMTEELKTWAVDKMAAFYDFLQPKLEAFK